MNSVRGLQQPSPCFILHLLTLQPAALAVLHELFESQATVLSISGITKRRRGADLLLGPTYSILLELLVSPNHPKSNPESSKWLYNPNDYPIARSWLLCYKCLVP